MQFFVSPLSVCLFLCPIVWCATVCVLMFADLLFCVGTDVCPKVWCADVRYDNVFSAKLSAKFCLLMLGVPLFCR